MLKLCRKAYWDVVYMFPLKHWPPKQYLTQKIKKTEGKIVTIVIDCGDWCFYKQMYICLLNIIKKSQISPRWTWI